MADFSSLARALLALALFTWPLPSAVDPEADDEEDDDTVDEGNEEEGEDVEEAVEDDDDDTFLSLFSLSTD